MIVKKLSIVVLCYKAGELVREVVSRITHGLQGESIDYEIVLVCNYLPGEESIDTTHTIAKELAQNNGAIRVVAKPKEGMMGWDMLSGLRAATGDTLLVTDGDGQMPLEDILKVYKKFVSGQDGLVKTYRVHRADGLYRKIISGIYNFVLKLLFPKVTVKDANSKPKIMTREVFEKLHLTATDWFIDAEIIINATYAGISIGQVETHFLKNEFRPSFVKIKALFEFTGNLIKHRFRLWFYKNG